MAKIEIKLKDTANREKLTTISGYEITKKKFIVVEDKDSGIETFIMNRSDLVVKEHKEKIKSSGKSKNTETFKE